MTEDNELTPEELAAMPRAEREAYERKMAWEQRDREEAANEVGPLYLTREEAEFIRGHLVGWNAELYVEVMWKLTEAMREKGML